MRNVFASEQSKKHFGLRLKVEILRGICELVHHVENNFFDIWVVTVDVLADGLLHVLGVVIESDLLASGLQGCIQVLLDFISQILVLGGRVDVEDVDNIEIGEVFDCVSQLSVQIRKTKRANFLDNLIILDADEQSPSAN